MRNGRLLPLPVLGLAVLGGCTDTLGSSKPSLSGEWQLTGAAPGKKSETGALVMKEKSFSLTIGRTRLDFSTESEPPRLTYTVRTRAYDITVARTPDAVSLGTIPLSVGGSYRFGDPEDNDGAEVCALQIGSAGHTFQCSRHIGSPWPSAIPAPRVRLRYVLTRVSPAASDFGDLGGSWTAGTDEEATCSISFLGNKVSASCPSGTSGLSGSFEATFNGDVVSGKTSGGVEFAGQR